MGNPPGGDSGLHQGIAEGNSIEIGESALAGDPPLAGLRIYVGTTGTGKTHKAIRDAIAIARASQVGVLVIDSRGAQNLEAIQEWPEDEAIQRVYQGEVARIIPEDQLEFDSLIRAVDRRGNVVLFIDEVSSWATNREMQRLIRVWRHRKVSILLTTQLVGRDLEQAVQACNPVIYAFRTTAPRTLEWFEKWHRIPHETLRGLNVGEYIRVQF